MLFVDFTATPDGVHRRTGCRDLFAEKKESWDRSRVRKRERNERVKGENDVPIGRSLRMSLHRSSRICIWPIHVRSLLCAPGERRDK